MSGFFDRLLGLNTPKGSSSKAKERLMYVLERYDRAGISLPPDRLEELSQRMLALISEYVSIDDTKVDIALQQRDRGSSLLIAQVPFSNRHEDAEKDDEDEPVKPRPKDADEDTSAG